MHNNNIELRKSNVEDNQQQVIKNEQSFNYPKEIEVNISDIGDNATPQVIINKGGKPLDIARARKLSSKIDSFFATLVFENDKVKKITLTSSNDKNDKLLCSNINNSNNEIKIIEITGNDLQFEGLINEGIDKINFRYYKAKIEYLKEAEQLHSKIYKEVHNYQLLNYVLYPLSVIIPLGIDSAAAYYVPNFLCTTMSYINNSITDPHNRYGKHNENICDGTYAYLTLGSITALLAASKLIELSCSAINRIEEEIKKITYKACTIKIANKSYNDLYVETMSASTVPSGESEKRLKEIMNSRITDEVRTM